MFDENKTTRKQLNKLMENKLKELMKDLDKSFSDIFFSMLEEYNEIGDENEKEKTTNFKHRC